MALQEPRPTTAADHSDDWLAGLLARWRGGAREQAVQARLPGASLTMTCRPFGGPGAKPGLRHVFEHDKTPFAGLYAFCRAAGRRKRRRGGSESLAVIHRPDAGDRARLGRADDGFVVVNTSSGDELPIRFFSARQEMDACGYVTLAAATALREAGHWTGTGTLTSASGRYVLTLTTDVVRLDVPIRDHRVISEDDGRAIGASLDRPLAGWPCEVITTGLRHLVVPIADDVALSAFAPDHTERAPDDMVRSVLRRTPHVDTDDGDLQRLRSALRAI